jgi:hypothetical protein
MKLKLTILFILIYSIGFSQNKVTEMPTSATVLYEGSIGSRVINIGKTYVQNYEWTPDFLRYETGLTTPLSVNQRIRINDLCGCYKDSLEIDSLAQFFDVVYIFANETEETALRNLVKRSFDATAQNTPTFAQFEGYTGGGTKYINSNFNPTSSGIMYTQNSASISIYTRTDVSGDYYDVGAVSGTAWSMLVLRTATNTIGGRINDDGGFSYSNLNSTGFYSVNRRTSLTREVYKNGESIGTSSRASTGLPNLNFYMLGYNYEGAFGKPSPRQLSLVLLGKGADDIQARKIYNCSERYMDSLGKGVVAYLTLDNTYLTVDNSQIRINDEY